MSGAEIAVTIGRVLFAVLVPLIFVPILVWLERRGASFIQDRPGPNRANVAGLTIGGLVQPIADALKLIFKEDMLPGHIKHKAYFIIAPMIVFAASLLTFAVIPFADDIVIGGQTFMMQGLPTDLGIVWFLGFAGLAVYGIILAGWSSNNKFGILGGLRATAQVISYEVPMGLAIMGLLIAYGTISLNGMVNVQGELLWGFIPKWGIVLQPLGFLIFMVTAVAESNRTPFDVAEGESEIVAGFHTEYSAMKFALFFMGEYVAMFVSSALIVTLYFGGYHIPWLNTETLRENAQMVGGALMFIVPLMLAMFLAWMWHNNRSHYERAKDPRVRETKFWFPVLIGLGLLIEAALAFGVLGGFSDGGAQVLVAIIQVVVFLVKTFLLGFFYVWIRWTLPRFRYDQLQLLGWQALLPLSLLNIFMTAIVVIVLN